MADEETHIDYPFEEVMYRTRRDGLVFVKFYGTEESSNPIPYSNRLYCDALRFGNQISRDDYVAGKPRTLRNRT